MLQAPSRPSRGGQSVEREGLEGEKLDAPTGSIRVAALLAIAIVGCGGGGGGSPTAPPPTPPPSLGLTFTSASPPVANSLSWRRQAGSQQDRLRLELWAEQVSDLYGIAFDLRLPAAVLRFEQLSEGTALSADGTVPTSFQFAQTAADRLVIGLTRLGQQPGLTGSAVLLTVELLAVGNGSGAVRFENNRAYSSRAFEQTSLVWIDGTGSNS